MYDRFTDRARTSMQLTRRAAERFGHTYVGTEHLLIGVIEEGSGSAIHALIKCGLNPEQISQEVSKLMTKDQCDQIPEQLPFTPCTKKVLEYAVRVAVLHGHNFVDTGHLLIGLIDEKEGLAAQVLLNHSLTEQKLARACLPYWLEQVLNQTTEPRTWREKLVAYLRNNSLLMELFSSRSNSLPYRKLTDEALRTIDCAREEAEKAQVDFLGTEHLLIALASCGAGPAADALSRMGVTRESILQRLLCHSSKESSCTPAPKSFPLTPRAKAALFAARDQATSLNRDCIGTEHLLLGLLADDGNSARAILKSAGVTMEMIRSETNALTHS